MNRLLFFSFFFSPSYFSFLSISCLIHEHCNPFISSSSILWLPLWEHCQILLTVNSPWRDIWRRGSDSVCGRVSCHHWRLPKQSQSQEERQGIGRSAPLLSDPASPARSTKHSHFHCSISLLGQKDVSASARNHWSGVPWQQACCHEGANLRHLGQSAQRSTPRRQRQDFGTGKKTVLLDSQGIGGSICSPLSLLHHSPQQWPQSKHARLQELKPSLQQIRKTRMLVWFQRA